MISTRSWPQALLLSLFSASSLADTVFHGSPSTQWQKMSARDPTPDLAEVIDATNSIEIAEIDRRGGEVWYNLTLVNGTPYPWRRDWVNSYRIPGWNEIWRDTIHPGETYTVSYGSHHGQDDAGDVKYKFEIDGKRTKGFHLQVHGKWDGTNRGMVTNAAVIEGLVCPGHSEQGKLWEIGNYYHNGYQRGDQGGADSWIVQGSEKDQYVCSDPPNQWMDSLGPEFKKLNFRQIFLPGSHDAGMSTVRDSYWGSFANTGTQSVGIYEQLVRGIRALDFRVYKVGTNGFSLGHWSNSPALGGGIGGMGQMLDEAIDDVKKFQEKYPGELIIIQINELRTSRPYGEMDDGLKLKAIDLLRDKFDLKKPYTLTQKDTIRIDQEPLQTFYNVKKSPVIVSLEWNFVKDIVGRIEGLPKGDGTTTGLMTSANLVYDVGGSYADKDTANAMRSDQWNKLMHRKTDMMFQTSFTLTQTSAQVGDIVKNSISALAQTAAGVMYDSAWRWAQDHRRWPNIAWFDFIDDHQMAGYAMAINRNFAYRFAIEPPAKP